ncbi:MAG: T9SS type A sorting domain-containing protein [Candidatus Kapaibacterium sp.]
MKQLYTFLMVFLTVPFALRAQTITLDSVSAPMTCDTAQVTVYYTATGTFGAKNVFTVQLSATDGSFTPTFTIIGSVKSTASGSIAVHIPAYDLNYDHYRVRVASSNPYLVSNDNGSDIQVLLTPPPAFYVWKDSAWSSGPYYTPVTGLEGDTVIFFSQETHWWYGKVFCEWNFGDGANPATSTDSFVHVTYSTPGAKQVYLKVTNAAGCSRDTTLPAVTIFDCNPAIPSNVIIDSTVMDLSSDMTPLFTSIWVVPGASLTLPWASGCTIFAEPGSSINGGSSLWNTIYVKPGATFTEGPGGGYGTNGNQMVIYAPGASVKARYLTTVLECNSLNFDYSQAPPYKITWAGVSTSGQASGISIYPNPATNLVTIASPEIPRSIMVRNELGETVLSDSGPIATTKLEFDASQFANGVYYVDLGFTGGNKTLKFTVAR